MRWGSLNGGVWVLYYSIVIKRSESAWWSGSVLLGGVLEWIVIGAPRRRLSEPRLYCDASTSGTGDPCECGEQ
jgi:hypothetical protein